MRALKVVLGVMFGLALLFVVVGLFLPNDYRVERSLQINAPPEVVFDRVNSLKNWSEWSPWIARDPTIRNTYEGPESGVGAKVSWTSEESGEGTQTIIVSERPTRIETALDFGGMGQPKADWTFEPNERGVLVTWGLTGTTEGPIGAYAAAFMDRMLGDEYEDGLLRLKQVAEAQRQDQ